jgi:hypothetical protein
MPGTPNTQPEDRPWSDLDQQYRDYEHRSEALDDVNKKALFDALDVHDIFSVTVSFDGCGDNGQIESIEINQDAEAALPNTMIEFEETFTTGGIKTSFLSLRQAIEAMVYRFLERTHCGWPDNEGAYGEFTFDTASRSITLDYNERYIETTNSTHTF